MKINKNEEINKIQRGDISPIFLYNTPWKKSIPFSSPFAKPVVLFFLRYIGCPICQLEISKIKKNQELLSKYNVFVVLQSKPETVANQISETDLPFAILCDPKEELFKLFKVQNGSLLSYLHPHNLLTLLIALSKGIMHGKFEGKEKQVPAVFVLLPNGKVQYAYYGKRIDDLPNLKVIVSLDLEN
ncbi:MAG TPA: redoxin domain-containing protein [Leptospiraceae bacterium]|nr:redoxin domain-containing protein [Leptospiraceae bacterium]HMX35282.1 redoxin domain-containing protein [Leptospiraceae bacterium]HMY34334.1 redoxin domain-containing protein [Leptospiraceae bacterium]HMZ66745.1 redoxin domain-containing protein [Leptospiraceae bacterium]HNA10304.1 redoxin domain-containing protein [Leptospiraceae bacterium]